MLYPVHIRYDMYAELYLIHDGIRFLLVILVTRSFFPGRINVACVVVVDVRDLKVAY